MRTALGRRARLGLLMVLLLGLAFTDGTDAQTDRRDTLPVLREPVNDTAGVIDSGSAARLDRMIRSLQRATGDTIVIVTVPRIEPYGDVREYAVDLFEKAGIGQREKDNGLLVLLAVGDRKVWIEVGYGLEGFITDGFAGETSRQYMAPRFSAGRYGEGLEAGVQRLAARIAQGRNVTLDDVPAAARPTTPEPRRRSIPGPLVFFLILLAIVVLHQIGQSGRRGRRHGRYWTRGPWSGWSGGVGPFGGTFGGWGGRGGGLGGGSWGGGGGGGFGGFGGGRSGGGGGGAGW